MQNEIYDEKNGLTYMLCGDYYLPKLALTDIEPTYGKYGMLRKSYLQECNERQQVGRNHEGNEIFFLHQCRT